MTRLRDTLRLMPGEEIFTEVPWTVPLQFFLDGLLPVRRDLLVDPVLATPWSCDPDRCRSRLGDNLCCKVETRCAHFSGGRCGIHTNKPFSCALFPLDLVRVNGVRVVTSPKNSSFFDTGWSRFDRDMLECFAGPERGTVTMFQTQVHVLLRVFTRAEVARLAQKLRLPAQPEEISSPGITSPGS